MQLRQRKDALEERSARLAEKEREFYARKEKCSTSIHSKEIERLEKLLANQTATTEEMQRERLSLSTPPEMETPRNSEEF